MNNVCDFIDEINISPCRQCMENRECRYFTLDTRKLMCYLKSERQSTEESEKTFALVSGNML